MRHGNPLRQFLIRVIADVGQDRYLPSAPFPSEPWQDAHRVANLELGPGMVTEYRWDVSCASMMHAKPQKAISRFIVAVICKLHRF